MIFLLQNFYFIFTAFGKFYEGGHNTQWQAIPTESVAFFSATNIQALFRIIS